MSGQEEDKKDDGVGSDVDSEEDDPLNGQLTSINPVALLSESFPNSPASLSIWYLYFVAIRMFEYIGTDMLNLL